MAGLDDLTFVTGQSGSGGIAGGGSGGSGAAGGDAGGGGPQLTFTDDDLVDFSAGTLQNVEWVTDHVALTLGNTEGELVSRVFDSQRERTRWQTIAHVTPIPYEKPLPQSREAETFAEGIDMADNILLLPFDATGALDDGLTVGDTSGRGNDLSVDAPGGAIALVPGVIGMAAEDTGSTRMFRTVSGGSDFEWGTSDFTWSVWLRFADGYDCTTNRSAIGLDGGDETHMWLGCAEPDPDCVPSGGPFGGGTWRAHHASQDGATYCGTSTINDGQWHHHAVVREGYPTGTIRYYLDGVLEDQESLTWDNPFQISSSFEVSVGSWNANKGAACTIDEIAMFRRGLSSEEIRNIYQRGAASLRFQVRACASADCSASAFVGPDGTTDTHFRHDDGAGGPNEPITLPDGVEGRYFQYRAEFRTRADSPELEAVTVTASVP